MNINLNPDNKTVLLTGAAGFIGAACVKRLFEEYPGIKIIGIDNMNSYYDVKLKEYRLDEIKKYSGFEFIKGDIADKALILKLFEEKKPDFVLHLAAQAGVRYSIDHPDVYINSNIIGFFNIIEACKKYPPLHFVYASSSSVYGANTKIPFSTEDKTDSPVSLYAATKKSNELLAYAYSKLYGIKSTGLRFFTVYGPAGRPDMAYFKFTDKLLKGEKIQIFNYGNCKRDFTYIDDITKGVVNVLRQPPCADVNGVPHKVYNIGGSKPENLLEFVKILKEELTNAEILPKDFDFDAHTELVPMQPGDVETTYADVSPLENDFGIKPEIHLREGIKRFAAWYKEYNKK